MRGYLSYTFMGVLHKTHSTLDWWWAVKFDRTNDLISSFPWLPSSSICNKKKEKYQKLIKMICKIQVSNIKTKFQNYYKVSRSRLRTWYEWEDILLYQQIHKLFIKKRQYNRTEIVLFVCLYYTYVHITYFFIKQKDDRKMNWWEIHTKPISCPSHFLLNLKRSQFYRSSHHK